MSNWKREEEGISNRLLKEPVCGFAKPESCWLLIAHAITLLLATVCSGGGKLSEEEAKPLRGAGRIDPLPDKKGPEDLTWKGKELSTNTCWCASLEAAGRERKLRTYNSGEEAWLESKHKEGGGVCTVPSHRLPKKNKKEKERRDDKQTEGKKTK